MKTLTDIANELGLDTAEYITGSGVDFRLHLQPGAMLDATLSWKAREHWSAADQLDSAVSRIAQAVADLHGELETELPGRTDVFFSAGQVHATKPIGTKRRQHLVALLEKERQLVSKLLGLDLWLAWACPICVVFADNSDWEFSGLVLAEQGSR